MSNYIIIIRIKVLATYKLNLTLTSKFSTLNLITKNNVIITSGFILRLPVWDQPRGGDLFDDESFWLMPPVSIEDTHSVSGVETKTTLHLETKDCVRSIELKPSIGNNENGIAHEKQVV